MIFQCTQNATDYLMLTALNVAAAALLEALAAAAIAAPCWSSTA